MSKVKTSVSGLDKAVAKALNSYNTEIMAKVEKAARKAGREAVKELKTGQSSPQFKGGDNSGYNSGWKMKTEQKLNTVSVVVHNVNAPGLTHLLEKGHAMPQGGRSRAFVHIAPAEEQAVETFKREVKEVIRDG